MNSNDPRYVEKLQPFVAFKADKIHFNKNMSYYFQGEPPQSNIDYYKLRAESYDAK